MTQHNMLHREFNIYITNQQLKKYSESVKLLPIAEGQLANKEIQQTLRGIIEEIFDEISPIVAGVKALARVENSTLPPEYYLLRGLRFNELEYSPNHDVRGSFIVGLSSFWGLPALGNYHQPDVSFAYRHIKSRPREDNESLTLLNSTRDGFPHTDSAFKNDPEPLFALFMARAAKDGGDTLLWSAKSLLDWISSQPNGKETIELLRNKKMPFVGSVLHADKVIYAPIIMEGSTDRIRYKRDAIEDAAKALGRPLNTEENFIMDTLDEATKSPEIGVRFAMGDGDAVMLDNQRTLHSRSGFTDTERHVLKTTIYTNISNDCLKKQAS